MEIACHAYWFRVYGLGFEVLDGRDYSPMPHLLRFSSVCHGIDTWALDCRVSAFSGYLVGALFITGSCHLGLY